MKVLIIGLGNFGASLATKLTLAGHEVIGVDSDMQRVEHVKEEITSAIEADCTDELALKRLPIFSVDVVVVAIGSEVGASILITAMLKQFGVKRIISRSLSDIHQTVLEAIGVKEIIHPEQDAATHLAEKMEMQNVIASINLYEGHNIVEVPILPNYAGKTLNDINFRKNFHLNILLLLRNKHWTNIMGIKRVKKALENVNPDTILEKDDILVVFGKVADIKRYMKNFNSIEDEDIS
jgi:trk system potassium uptake protein TrkA